MTDDEQPGAIYSAKTSASGHGQAYTSQRDMTNQDITIKDSVVVVVMRRVEETMERVQYAETLRDGVDELKTRLAAMTEAARIAATRLKREVDRARSEGRQEALVEAEAQLQDAERRRKEAEARLRQAQEERDHAVQVMKQAQLQALNARNELEELRRREQLEADLAQARTELQRAATAGGTVRAEAYADQIASADAELGDFHEQLALLSAELKESSQAEPQPSATADDSPLKASSSATTSSAASPSVGRADRDAKAAQTSTIETDPENIPRKVPPELRTTSLRPFAVGPQPVAEGRTAHARASALAGSPAYGIALALPIMICCAVEGTGTNIMIHAPVGPAIMWQILYACIAFVMVVLVACIVLIIVETTTTRYGYRARRVFTDLVILVAPLVLIAAIIFPSRTVPVLAPVAHWLVHYLGLM